MMSSKNLVKLHVLLFLVILTVGRSWAGELNGKIVAVHDGDTVTLLIEKTQIKIRLAGIDAPELRQSFGAKAKQALSGLVFGKVVKVTDDGKDRYGRTIGDIYVGARWVNLELVDKGMAWVYLAYSHNPVLLSAEAKAKAVEAGLWHDPNPVPPWEWRKEKVAK